MSHLYKMSQSQNSQRSRNWCFTIFDYNDGLLEHLRTGLQGVKHCIFQEEVAPTTGRKHLQGHVVWKLQKSMSATKKALKSPSCHLEVMRGTVEQSAAYCEKDDTHVSDGVRVEIGERPTGQGYRSDLDECIGRIRSGELKYSDIELYYPQLFVQYRNGLREICDKYRGSQRNYKSHVSVYYGKSGTGKSMKAFESSNDIYVLRCSKTGVWFDGYDYNDTLVIDDFYGWLPFNLLLNLLDRYSMKVDIKGGAMEFNSKNIIITSNKSPLDWYPNLSTEHQIALLRRLDVVSYFDRKGVTNVTTGLQRKLHELMADAEGDCDDELMALTQDIAAEAAQKKDGEISPFEKCLISEVPPGNTILPVLGVEMLPDNDTTASNVSNVHPSNTPTGVIVSDVCPATSDVCPVLTVSVEWDDLDGAYIDLDGNSYSTLEDVEQSFDVPVKVVVKSPRVLKRSKTIRKGGLLDYLLDRV